MARAWQAHKGKDYATALSAVMKIWATDWREACYVWLKARRAAFEQREEADVG
jgi:hypothetical protein